MKAGAIVADGTYDELVAQGVDLDLENVDDKDMEEGKEGEEAAPLTLPPELAAQCAEARRKLLAGLSDLAARLPPPAARP